VKVEVNDVSDKNNKVICFKSENKESEELTIKIELDDQTGDDSNKLFPSNTKVKYCVQFHELPHNKTFNFDGIEKKTKKIKNRKFSLPQNLYTKSSSTKKDILNCKGVPGGLNKEFDAKLYNIC